MKIRNITEAMQPRPKIKYYIDRIIRPASLNMFYAEPGTGKSLAFITMGICFASHEIDNWLGFDLNEKGKVLFIQEEMGDEGFLEFLEETYRGFFGGEKRELPFDFTIFQNINFSDNKSVAELAKVVKEKEYKLIFMDSFAAMTNDNEDKKEDMQPILNKARLITALPSKPSVIFTHHPTKNNFGFRGSGAIKAALDLMVAVKKKSSDLIEFTMEKNRYRPCISWEAKKTFEKDMDGNDVFIFERTDKPSNLQERQELMITIIENNPDFGQSEIIDMFVRMGGKKIDAAGILKMLDESEITEVVQDSIGGKGKKKIRKLTSAFVAERMSEGVAEIVNTFSGNGKK